MTLFRAHDRRLINLIDLEISSQHLVGWEGLLENPSEQCMCRRAFTSLLRSR